MRKVNQAGGTLLVLLAATLWGLIGLFVARLNALQLNEMQVLLCRLVLAVILLLGYLLIRDPSLLRIRLRDLWMFVGTGMLSLLFFNFCYFSTIVEMGVSSAVVLLYTSPVFVMLFSAVFFKEKITWRKIAALLCAITSCALIAGVFSGGEITLWGLLLGLGSGFGYALYSVFGQVALRRYSSMTITFYTFLLALIGALPLSDLTHFPQSYWSVDGLISTVGISLLCTVFAYLCYTKGLACMPAGRAAVLATVEPAVGMIVGVLFLGEEMTVWKLLGGLMILTAIVILNVNVGKGKSHELPGGKSGTGNANGQSGDTKPAGGTEKDKSFTFSRS